MAEDLIFLIRSGKPRTGTPLLYRGRSSRSIDATATVVEGGLRMMGWPSTTLSGTARAIIGKPVDGWTSGCPARSRRARCARTRRPV